MKNIQLIVLMAGAAITSHAEGLAGKKTYECKYMPNPPQGVYAWALSEMVETGRGKESRLVPYNSKAAQGLWLDATTTRDVVSEAEAEGCETSFYMAYNEKGWTIYIQCDEPNMQSYIDTGKDISLEIFFCPGLEQVPYYQMIVRQLAGKVTYYDWAMPHRHYRSLEGRITVESRAIEGGVATCLFIPWEPLYDRLPLNGDIWRFSFMRWGGVSLTWGGKVHDTGNFGLVKFAKPPAEVAQAIEKRMLRAAWFRFLAESKKAAHFWEDERIGDPDFYSAALKPLIDEYQAFGESLGAPGAWDAAALRQGQTMLPDWMEFRYKLAELRSSYLMDRHIP